MYARTFVMEYGLWPYVPSGDYGQLLTKLDYPSLLLANPSLVWNHLEDQHNDIDTFHQSVKARTIRLAWKKIIPYMWMDIWWNFGLMLI